jgi:DNA-binding MarR family transcriptional regulator
MKFTPSTGPDRCYSLAGRRGARHLTRIYDRHFAPAGITNSQFSILSTIDFRPEITATELADAMVMERTTLLRALEPLQRSGWVRTAPLKKGRALCYAITSAGKAKIAEAEPCWLQAQADFEARFGKERAEALRDILLSIPFEE